MLSRLHNSRKLLPVLLVLCGAGIIFLAGAMELTGAGSPGFGAFQVKLIVAGLAILLTGPGLATAAGQRSWTRY